MLDAIKQLVENNVINEETRESIMEAWEAKLNEAREELRVELREEFANRYNHDKKVMVEALDKMISEGLQSEIKEFREEKSAMAADRVVFRKQMKEHAARFNNFMVAKLAEEIKELRNDRQKQQRSVKTLEGFVSKQLAKEIREFANDKQDVVNTKVKLVAEARKQLETLKKRFIKESAARVQSHVRKQLTSEISTLHEDIKVAHENNFGRKVFEAFLSEFVTTHLNENAEVRKLKKIIADKDKVIAESTSTSKKLKMLAESKEKEIRMITERNKRAEALTELLAPLNKEKRKVMSELLESVQTDRLSVAFEKYLPAVLSNNSVQEKKIISENVARSVTGDKTAKPKLDIDSNIIDIQKLAGLK